MANNPKSLIELLKESKKSSDPEYLIEFIDRVSFLSRIQQELSEYKLESVYDVEPKETTPVDPTDFVLREAGLQLKIIALGKEEKTKILDKIKSIFEKDNVTKGFVLVKNDEALSSHLVTFLEIVEETKEGEKFETGTKPLRTLTEDFFNKNIRKLRLPQSDPIKTIELRDISLELSASKLMQDFEAFRSKTGYRTFRREALTQLPTEDVQKLVSILKSFLSRQTEEEQASKAIREFFSQLIEKSHDQQS